MLHKPPQRHLQDQTGQGLRLDWLINNAHVQTAWFQEEVLIYWLVVWSNWFTQLVFLCICSHPSSQLLSRLSKTSHSFIMAIPIIMAIPTIPFYPLLSPLSISILTIPFYPWNPLLSWLCSSIPTMHFYSEEFLLSRLSPSIPIIPSILTITFYPDYHSFSWLSPSVPIIHFYLD